MKVCHAGQAIGGSIVVAVRGRTQPLGRDRESAGGVAQGQTEAGLNAFLLAISPAVNGGPTPLRGKPRERG